MKDGERRKRETNDGERTREIKVVESGIQAATVVGAEKSRRTGSEAPSGW